MRASPAGRGRLPALTPVLFVIDGDPGAAHALRDDLSRRFGREFRIVCESAADAGLAALRELAVRCVPVALLVVGQDLNGMSGVAFLGRAHEIGTLETGKLGDVLVVEGDVLADISRLEDRKNILAVFQGGVLKSGRLAAYQMAV